MKLFNVALLALAAAPSLVQAAEDGEGKTLFEIGECIINGGDGWDFGKEAHNELSVNFDLMGEEDSLKWFSWAYAPCDAGGTPPEYTWNYPMHIDEDRNPDAFVYFFNPEGRHIDEVGETYCVKLKLFFGGAENCVLKSKEFCIFGYCFTVYYYDCDFFQFQQVAEKECKVDVSVTDFGEEWVVEDYGKKTFDIKLNEQEGQDQGDSDIKTVDLEITKPVDDGTQQVWFGQDFEICVKDHAGASIEITKLYISDEYITEDNIETLENIEELTPSYCDPPAADVEVDPVTGEKIPQEVCCTIPGSEVPLTPYFKAFNNYIKATIWFDFSPTTSVRRLGAPDRVLQESSERGQKSVETKVQLVDPATSGGSSQAGLFMAGAVAVLGMIAL